MSSIVIVRSRSSEQWQMNGQAVQDDKIHGAGTFQHGRNFAGNVMVTGSLRYGDAPIV